MVAFKVTLTSVEIHHPQLVVEMAPILRRVHSRLRRSTAEQARLGAPVRSGRLRSMIREDPTRERPLWVGGGVTSHAPYSIFQEKGAREHIIRARNASALRFFWPKVGYPPPPPPGVVTFRSVRHPGQRARPFMMHAAYRAAALDPDIRMEPI